MPMAGKTTPVSHHPSPIASPRKWIRIASSGQAGPPQDAAHAQLADDLEGLDRLAGVDLGVARAAVLEQDRGLAELAADGPAPVEDLLHEGVSPRTDPVEVDL